jgi:ADP-ribose pyrophosphatase YjhB (NUDIX family)
VVIRVDALGLVDGKVLAAEVIGGYYGQKALGRWWLPCAELRPGEQPAECAARAVKEQLGLTLAETVVVGTRQHEVAGAWQLALVVAGTLSGEPNTTMPVSGFAVKPLAEHADNLGFWHRDEVAILVERYRRLST